MFSLTICRRRRQRRHRRHRRHRHRRLREFRESALKRSPFLTNREILSTLLLFSKLLDVASLDAMN